ncbi:3-phosphoshikimate 1-carboxyvinyltransferase [Candidatus Aerophobetes bacterium]|nr:3-phosphoshikimate 1-carboxyvinyltransferase [Candidatus Aerophobetes bacterium]
MIVASSSLQGKMKMLGDKSISHRAVILASIAQGKSCIEGIQEGKDLLATMQCMQNLGVQIEEDGKYLFIEGKGLRGLKEPEDILNCQNSGTTMRILSGVLSAQNFYSVLTGDISLRKRPMERIVLPLGKMGARIWSRKGYLAPLSIKGGALRGIEYSLPVASAQVKSSLLLAGLYAEGVSRVKEPYPSRDHTERMLSFMDADIHVDSSRIAVRGGKEIKARDFFIPGDFSAAAFFIGGAAVLEGSRVKIEKVGVNPTRCGFLEILIEMGAKIKLCNRNIICNEEVADIEVESTSKLQGVKVNKEKVPRFLDEIPILAVVACFAEGKTLIEGAKELRVKETDRIKALCVELNKMGARIEEREDGMLIQGAGKLKGTEVYSWEDHRIAMALAIAGILAQGTTVIHNARCIDISFPDFWEKLEKIRGRRPRMR